MIAAKAFDPVLGVDIHIIQPPGPVPPVPVPHPFVGMLIDPMDFAPIIGATVMVNGMPRATAGTGGKCIPPHIPIGGVFVKPPANECEVFMGSATVLADGDPLSRLGMPALSCHDVGMPAPPRPKKKRKTKSLVLPTSVVLSVPAGAPVLVGGPPTISMMALGMKAAMAGLGAAFKKLKKVAKGSRRMKALSKKAHAAAKKAMDKLGVPPSVQNKVHRAICTVTGHPVDVATGKVFTEAVDFELPGPIPFRWERVWYSCSVYDGPLGHGWHHAYDVALWVDDDVVGVRLQDGRSIAFELPQVGDSRFDRNERLTLIHDTLGLGLRTHQGMLLRFESIRYQAGLHALASIEDPAGHRIRFDNDRNGRVQQIFDSAGRRLALQHDDAGRITGIFGPHPMLAGEQVSLARYQYDEFGNLTQVADANGAIRTMGYNGSHLVRETDRNGLSFYFEYDAERIGARCVHTWGDGGIYSRHIEYDETFKRTVVTDSLGHKATHEHDGVVVLRTVDGLGRMTAYAFDEGWRLILETNALGSETSFEYDERGNRTVISRPEDETLSIEYDHFGQPVHAVDPAGGTWQWSYDQAQRLVERIDPLGRQTRYVYEGGNLIGIEFPGNQPTKLEYDGTGNLVALTDARGAVTRWQYDLVGRPIIATDPAGNTQRRSYDLMGRLVRVEEPDGNVRDLDYDGEGRIRRVRDRSSDITFQWRGVTCLTSKAESGAIISFKYDSEERLLAVSRDENTTYLIRRNIVGEVEEEIGFDGVRRKFRRDPLGNVARLEWSDGFTDFEYDKVERLVRRRHSDGTLQQFKWTPGGYLGEAWNNEVGVKFQRNVMGQLLRESVGDHWIESAYDERGQRAQTLSSLGIDCAFRTDAVGNLLELSSSAADVRLEFERDPYGNELERKSSTGVRLRWNRDEIGRPTGIEVEDTRTGETALQRRYAWQLGEKLVEVSDENTGSRHFDYGPMGWLWRMRSPGRDVVRLADRTGNLYRTAEREDRTFGKGGQLLEQRTQPGAERRLYDGRGHLAKRIDERGGEWRYHWDGIGSLVRVDSPSGRSVEFAYDALGRRVLKRVGASTTRWLWDSNCPAHEWMETADQGGNIATKQAVTWLFEPGTATPLLRITNDGPSICINDPVGSPFAIFGERAQEVWAADIDPWGDIYDIRGDASACPFRWPGQYEDVETGLYYNRFRYYDPSAGQYISPDPVRLLGGTNLYSYTRNPNRQTDILGLNPQDIALGLSVAPYKGPDGKVIGKKPGALSDFAKDPVGDQSVKASTWTSFDEAIDENGMVDFEKTIKGGMDDAERIHFNVEGMDNWQEICNSPDPSKFRPPSTNWELATVMSDGDLKKKTTLYDGPGKPLKCP